MFSEICNTFNTFSDGRMFLHKFEQQKYFRFAILLVIHISSRVPFLALMLQFSFNLIHHDKLEPHLRLLTLTLTQKTGGDFLQFWASLAATLNLHTESPCDDRLTDRPGYLNLAPKDDSFFHIRWI